MDTFAAATFAARHCFGYSGLPFAVTEVASDGDAGETLETDNANVFHALLDGDMVGQRPTPLHQRVFYMPFFKHKWTNDATFAGARLVLGYLTSSKHWFLADCDTSRLWVGPALGPVIDAAL